MTKVVKLIFFYLLLCSISLPAQDTLSRLKNNSEKISLQLDSIINQAPVFGKTAVIFVSSQQAMCDTINARHYKFKKDGPFILFRYKGKTETRIRAEDLWGVINEYGERRRIYNGRLLTLWNTQTPYIYKSEGCLNTYYYFSESLCGKVYPLSNDIIESTIQHKAAKDKLYAYMIRYDISGTGTDKKTAHEFLYATADFLITLSVNFTGVVLECLLNSLSK